MTLSQVHASLRSTHLLEPAFMLACGRRMRAKRPLGPALGLESGLLDEIVPGWSDLEASCEVQVIVLAADVAACDVDAARKNTSTAT